MAIARASMTWKKCSSAHRSAAYQTSYRPIVVSEHLDTTFRPKIKPSSIAIDETTEYRRSSSFHASFGVEVGILRAPTGKKRSLSHQKGG
jgi:hypothetical protein